MISLSDAMLNDLPETIARPTYDRAALNPGIVHVGLGNFHLVESSRFADAFERWLDRIWSEGCEASLHAYAAP